MEHKKYLDLALEQAFLASKRGDYPIGAVIVDDLGNVVSSHGNESFSRNDVAAHAELLCFKDLGPLLSKKNPSKYTLYTSLEPCYGCGFFTTYTNIKTVVWALTDPYKGGIEDLQSLPKISDSFKDLTFIEEPDETCKTHSKKLMYEYHLSKGNVEKANNYL